jgi:hypothetical protein
MKFLKYLFLILGCIVWVVGLSPALFSEMMRRGWIEDGYHYGDLYRLSNLTQFKDPRKACTGYVRPAKAPAAKRVHLYVIGDSFTEEQRTGQADLVVDAYTWVHWDNFLHLKIDTTETNILLMESVERHFREKMAKPLGTLIPDTATFVAKHQAPKIMQQIDDAFRASSTQDRLDGLLFQNDIFLTVKQWKADFNQKIFNRVNKSVTLVNNDRDLVYYMDTDTTSTSSFHELHDTEVDSIVSNIDKSRITALSLGFDQVILAIVPNKVSVLDPGYGNYNRLIERVYGHPSLSIPFIDVLADYRRINRQSYLKGDSHWTCEGQTIWLNKVNVLINDLVKQGQTLQ